MQEDIREKRRIGLFVLGLFCVLVGLGLRLGFFHLANHSRLKYDDHTQTSLGIRGRIFDGCDNQIQMAVSLPAWKFDANRSGFLDKHKKVEIKDRIFTDVSGILNIPYETVVSAFAHSTNAFMNRTLGISADPAVYDALMRDSKHISGIQVKEIALRSYPQGRRMAHVVGFLDWQGLGVAGIEKKYEDQLKGTDGLKKYKLDGSSKTDKTEREIPDRRYVDVQPIPGSDVYLTLDNNIQYYVETALKEGVEKVNASNAWAIVQDVKSGAILAMASYPDFDLNDYGAVSKEFWRNDSITAMYEPGSVMKTITLAAALNEKLVTANTLIDVGYGDFFYANTTLKNNSSGKITVARGFKISNNVVFAKLGLMLEPRRIEKYLLDFGFGKRLDIELPGEAKGMIDAAGRPWNKWDKIKPTRVPIGQGVSVTALQMINAYSAIANGGQLMRPYVVKKVVTHTPTGDVVDLTEPKKIGPPVVRPEVAQVVRELMIDVTEEGTGTKARVAGYTVAGKTGTAQCWIPEKKAYSTTEFYASFVGFVPARAPRFSVLVTVNRPAPGFARTGGAVAAPIFANIATPTARYLEVPPDALNEKDTN